MSERIKVRKPQGADQLVVEAGGKVLVKNGGAVAVEAGGAMIVSGEILVKNGGRISAEPGGVIADNLAELTPKKGLAAALTTAIGVAQAELVFTAKTRGKAGNDITIEYVDPEEANAAVSVDVVGTVIKVNLMPGGGEAITTTANDIIATLADNELVSVAKKAGNDGTGVVTGMAATALTGGQDATEAKKGDICFDNTNIYIAIDDVNITDDGSKWRKIAHSAL